MKPNLGWLPTGLLVGAFGLCCSCSGLRRTEAPLTEVQISGTPGASITGYYIRKGKRTELGGALPITLQVPEISQVVIRKVRMNDTLLLAAVGPNGQTSSSLPPGSTEGLCLDLEDGMSISRMAPGESLSTPRNSLTVIVPYWYEGSWVFDDPKTGLVREPFVAGVPEILEFLVQDIPDARKGFRLTFSTTTFPGFQKKLQWVRAESGGNYYRLADRPMEGWLCPAMFRYFSRTPKEIYVRADPKSE